MPYSTSVPITRRTVILKAPSPELAPGPTLSAGWAVRLYGSTTRRAGVPAPPADRCGAIEVLAGVTGRLDRAARRAALAPRGARTDAGDPVALLAGGGG